MPGAFVLQRWMVASKAMIISEEAAVIKPASRLGIDRSSDPALDLDTLSLTPEVLVIARALQDYGLIVVDGSAVFKIYLQNVGPRAEAWKPFNFDTIEKIPIDRLRVLSCDIQTRQ